MTRAILPTVPTEIYIEVSEFVEEVEAALAESVELWAEKHFTAAEWAQWLSIKDDYQKK